MWKLADNKSEVLLAYRTTPLPVGYSTSELKIERPTKSVKKFGKNRLVVMAMRVAQVVRLVVVQVMEILKMGTFIDGDVEVNTDIP